MMDVNGMKHEAKLAGWTERVEECRKSGLSVREWCTERGVSVATYYRWEREVLSGMERNGKEDETEAETRFVEIPELGTGVCRGRMVAEMETAKARIRVYEGADAEVVRALCEAASC